MTKQEPQIETDSDNNQKPKTENASPKNVADFDSIVMVVRPNVASNACNFY